MYRLIASAFLIVGVVFITTNCKKENTATSLKPYIEVLGANPTNWGLGAEYIDAGAKVWSITVEQDTIDISDRLVVVHNVDVDNVGEYLVRYNATNEEGVKAAEQSRVVNVVITK